VKLDDQQRAHLSQSYSDARQRSEFAVPAGWLTYYLDAIPEVLQLAVANLSEAGLSNLDGAEGGFLYAKQPTAFDESALISNIESIASLCDDLGVKVSHIDLDTSPDAEQLKFHCLLHMDGHAQTH
jgi:hypothetical protein